MKKRSWTLLCVIMLLVFAAGWFWYIQARKGENPVMSREGKVNQDLEIVNPSEKLTLLEDGLSVMQYDEEYGFQQFLDAGGASSDEEVVLYLMNQVLDGVSGLQFRNDLFGCSTIQSINAQQEILFGRNFDWENSQALIIQSSPKDAYASVATVNLDFIQNGTSMPLDRLPDDVLAQIALYAPLDGMNEKGLVVSVNMIQDSDEIAHSGKKQNLTTTTAIRLLLNKAADVEEAIQLLQAYDLHSSMGMMIHFAIADASGRSVVVEYINNELHVIPTPVVTNFYLTPGEKYRQGSAQSQERYDILMNLLEEQKTMDMEQVRDALDRVSKDNFDEFASTEWSIVYNLHTLEAHYYHREHYDKRYIIRME